MGYGEHNHEAGKSHQIAVDLTCAAYDSAHHSADVEGINVSSIINRAVSLYEHYMTAKSLGGKLLVREMDGSTHELIFVNPDDPRYSESVEKQ